MTRLSGRTRSVGVSNRLWDWFSVFTIFEFLCFWISSSFVPFEFSKLCNSSTSDDLPLLISLHFDHKISRCDSLLKLRLPACSLSRDHHSSSSQLLHVPVLVLPVGFSDDNSILGRSDMWTICPTPSDRPPDLIPCLRFTRIYWYSQPFFVLRPNQKPPDYTTLFWHRQTVWPHNCTFYFALLTLTLQYSNLAIHIHIFIPIFDFNLFSLVCFSSLESGFC